VPCKGGVPLTRGRELRKLSSQLPDWKVLDGTTSQGYVFPDFKTALDFVNRVGAVAEAEGIIRPSRSPGAVWTVKPTRTD